MNEGDECPECGLGTIVIRSNSKSGSRFYACDLFPECKFSKAIKAAKKGKEPSGVAIKQLKILMRIAEALERIADKLDPSEINEKGEMLLDNE